MSDNNKTQPQDTSGNNSPQENNKRSIIDKLKKGSKPVDVSPESENKEGSLQSGYTPDEVKQKIDDYNKNARPKVLLEHLAPQLVDNEKQKRKLKTKLLFYIKIMIAVQIALIAIPVIFMSLSVFVKWEHINNIDIAVLEVFCSFLKYYISVIIAEFVAMLFFIVKYIFDKSISDLVKDFKKDD
ncbi:MAG: hypothetical protein IJA34_01085 [Lachnospiraceae bacterium]|nr:hypothetical protein [Lachnospiraceae bacterium]